MNEKTMVKKLERINEFNAVPEQFDYDPGYLRATVDRAKMLIEDLIEELNAEIAYTEELHARWAKEDAEKKAKEEAEKAAAEAEEK